MLNDHAIIEREGFKVPLIGIPPSAVEQECECCHKIKPIREVEMDGTGKLLCAGCRTIKK